MLFPIPITLVSSYYIYCVYVIQGQVSLLEKTLEL